MARARKLAAIMFTDMVGFTAAAQRDEPLALRLRAEQQNIVRSLLAGHEGREVKSIGDGFLIEFASVVAAVECAVQIQAAVGRLNAGRPIEQSARLRIGIHVGDVVAEGDDLVGDAVNVASRVESAVEPGGICLSGPAAEYVRNKVSFSLEPMAPRGLKNVEGPLALFRVGEGLSRSPGVGPPGSSVAAVRVAILPFANVSPDPQDEYFADGLTEELIGVVSRIPGVSVISRTSAMRYKGRNEAVGRIGQELRVGTVLEGSVRKIGTRVRVTARLIDAGNDDGLWSEQFDRELSDVFAIQGEIAERVATALRMRLLPSTGLPPPSADPEAYTLYLKGRYFWNKSTKEWLEKAVAAFAGAERLAPGYAAPLAGLADAYLLLGRRGDLPPAQAYPEAVRYALRALELNPALAEPHAALGSIHQEYEWRWEDSEREFRKAIELNPSYSTGYSWYGLYLGHVGRFEQALAATQRAQELDPLSARIHAGAAEEYIFARQYDRAIKAAERALEIDPTYGGGLAYVAEAHVGQGEYEQAISEFERADQLFGAQACAGRLGHAHALAGHREKALEVARTLEAGFRAPTAENPFLTPSAYLSLDIALVYLGLGELSKAIAWMETARDQRVPEVVHFAHEPIYDPVQHDPRFRAICRSVGLAAPEDGR